MNAASGTRVTPSGRDAALREPERGAAEQPHRPRRRAGALPAHRAKNAPADPGALGPPQICRFRIGTINYQLNFDVNRFLMSTSKFNLMRNWWASKSSSDHSLTSLIVAINDRKDDAVTNVKTAICL